MYDKKNIFAKIIDGSLPSEKIFEDEKIIAIKDIKPVAPIHILVIPKGEYIDFEDFVKNSTPSEISHYFKIVAEIAKKNGADNYRIVSNKGFESGQTVFHFHTHILSGIKNKNLLDENL